MTAKMLEFLFITCTLVTLSLVESEAFTLRDILERIKRDDGSFLHNSGGPLASNPRLVVNPKMSAGIQPVETVELTPSKPPTPSKGSCSWEMTPGKVMTKIAEGDVDDKEYKFLGHVDCTTLFSCTEECRRKSCNYFFKSSINGQMQMYNVADKLLAQNDWTRSYTYDSFIWKC